MGSRPVMEEANQSGLINEVGVSPAVSGGPFLDGEGYVHAGLQPVKTITSQSQFSQSPSCEKALGIVFLPGIGSWPLRVVPTFFRGLYVFQHIIQHTCERLLLSDKKNGAPSD